MIHAKLPCSALSLCLALGAFTPAGHANDGLVFAPLKADAGARPTTLLACDLDGDGVLDLLAGSSSVGGATAVLGHGDLTFSETVSLSPSSDVNEIAAGDVNGDGALDAALATPAGVIVHLGNGDGTFQGAPSTVAPGAVALAVATRDLDDDGHLDLMITDSLAKTLQVHRGAGDGSFSLSHTASVGTVPSRLELADLDGDDQLDVVVLSTLGDDFDVFLGQGDGTLAPSLPFFAAAGFENDFKLADTTGDGIADIVELGNVGSTGVIVLRPGLGDGTFGAPVTAFTDHRAVQLELADVDGDGRTDAVTSLTLGGVAVNYGLSGGSFGDAHVLSGDSGFALVVGDFNGDGAPDAIASEEFADELAVHPDLDRADPLPVQGGDFPGDMLVRDLTGDGHLDLALLSRADEQVVIRVGFGNGNFGSGQTVPVGQSPRQLAAADVNGDAMLDLVTTNADSNDVSVCINLGGGTFAPASSVLFVGNPFDLLAVDLNGDGAIDLATCDSPHSQIAWLLGNGAGAFFGPFFAPTALAAHELAAGDLNGDGVLDLAQLEFNQGDVEVLLGTGGGAFATLTPVNLGPLATVGLVLADVNGDGQLDAAGTNQLDGTMHVLLGNGDGTFAQPVITVDAGGMGPAALTFGDVDGDGHLDALTSNFSSRNVSLLRGTGTGQFGGLQKLGFVNPGLLALGDVDEDGLDDLLVLSTLLPEVEVRLNRSDAPWSGLHNSLAGSAGTPALTGDGMPLIGQQVVLTLAQGLPAGVAWRVVGLSAAHLPIKGGVLVPNPDLVVGPLVLDAALGTLSTVSTWPAGMPPGITFVIQDWIVDPGGPAGFAASNGLALTAP
jgi:hypothetical protein